MTIARRNKLAVVLFNLGGPDSPEAVRPFLYNLFRDPAIIGLPAGLRQLLAALISTTREKSAQANYAMMGGRSPILPLTEDQADALRVQLEAKMPDTDVRTFIAMRYWHPLTEATARAVEAFGPDQVVLLPLYPQYSSTTTASSLKAWTSAYKGSGTTHTVCCYPTDPDFITSHVDQIVKAFEKAGSPDGVRLLFSAHGLPEKIIKAGDPYQAQVEITSAAVAAALETRTGRAWDWQVCYQSRVGPLKWIGPSTSEAIEKAATDGKGILLSPIAFVSEHIETLVELDHEYAELAHDKGVTPYLRVPALGVDSRFISALSQAVIEVCETADGTIRPARACALCPAPFKCQARAQAEARNTARPAA